MRKDLQIISDWIKPKTTVLDIGCGDGRLLQKLSIEKQINGYGIEIDNDNINQCIKKGVNVIQEDIDTGLNNFLDQSFDYVIMSQTLQAMQEPLRLLEQMLRIGKECVVTFPNFGYWRCRFDLAIKGKMPVSKALPHEWYETHNIHLCTIKDFNRVCREHKIQILEQSLVDTNHKDSFWLRVWPNALTEIALYRLSK